jgi:hypothetical protein
MLATVYLVQVTRKQKFVYLSEVQYLLKHVLNNAQGKNNYSWGPLEGETNRYYHHYNIRPAKSVMKPSIDTNR